MGNIRSTIKSEAGIAKLKLKRGIKLFFGAVNILIVVFMILSLFPVQHISVFIAELLMYCAILAVVNALYMVIKKLVQKNINKAKVPEITDELEEDIAYKQFKKYYYKDTKS